MLHQVSHIVPSRLQKFKTLKILYCGYFRSLRSCNDFVSLTVVVNMATIVYYMYVHQCLSHRTGLSILYVVISKCRN
jgi:hypothetical protein